MGLLRKCSFRHNADAIHSQNCCFQRSFLLAASILFQRHCMAVAKRARYSSVTVLQAHPYRTKCIDKNIAHCSELVMAYHHLHLRVVSVHVVQPVTGPLAPAATQRSASGAPQPALRGPSGTASGAWPAVGPARACVALEPSALVAALAPPGPPGTRSKPCPDPTSGPGAASTAGGTPASAPRACSRASACGSSVTWRTSSLGSGACHNITTYQEILLQCALHNSESPEIWQCASTCSVPGTWGGIRHSLILHLETSTKQPATFRLDNHYFAAWRLTHPAPVMLCLTLMCLQQ